MISTIGQNIETLCSEYGLDRELVIEAMKEAVKAAARKQFRAQESIEVEWNNEDGVVEISAQKEVVLEVENPSTELSLTEAQELAGDEVELGDVLLIPLPTEELGRIAAQTAKQILVQKVREAVRAKIYDEYIERVGELVNGQVKRFEHGNMIVELTATLEAAMPRKEQVRNEMWNANDRIRVVIADVGKELKGQQLIVSRASEELLKRLFEMEVPEIYDGTVVIKSAVREPGDRAKIAVTSNEKDVDPVGACVGMKGSRVQSIIKELRGEKIDIIQWSDEPSIFAANALSPAKVSQVRITDIDARKMAVIVPEDQLSLAIGRHGQNVRLATKLVGWNIDIVSEEVLKKEISQQIGKMMASGEPVPLSALGEVSAANVETLNEKGIDSIDKLAAVPVDDLVEMLDVSLDEAEKILRLATSAVEARDAKPEDATETTESLIVDVSNDAETAAVDETSAASEENDAEIAEVTAETETEETEDEPETETPVIETETEANVDVAAESEAETATESTVEEPETIADAEAMTETADDEAETGAAADSETTSEIESNDSAAESETTVEKPEMETGAETSASETANAAKNLSETDADQVEETEPGN